MIAPRTANRRLDPTSETTSAQPYSSIPLSSAAIHSAGLISAPQAAATTGPAATPAPAVATSGHWAAMLWLVPQTWPGPNT